MILSSFTPGLPPACTCYLASLVEVEFYLAWLVSGLRKSQMGIKVSAGLLPSSTPEEEPAPGLVLLAVSTQFLLAAAGLRCSVPAGCHQGHSLREYRPPRSFSWSPPPHTALVCPAILCLRRRSGASRTAVLLGPLSSPSPLSCVSSRETV